jgi:hypothetical protein
VEIGNFDRQHSCSEKLWACSAVHRTFNRFQAVDLTFRLTIVSGQLDGVADGADITAKNASKTGYGGEPRMASSIHPSSFLEARLRNMPRNRIARLRKAANVFDPCLRASTFRV